MANHCHSVRPERGNFAIYCGGGVYVSEVTNGGVLDFAHTIDDVKNAGAFTRRVAVSALHTARRAGLRAWLIRHPLNVAA